MNTYIVVYQLPVYVTLTVKASNELDAEKKAFEYAVHGHKDTELLSEEWSPHSFLLDTVTKLEEV